MYTRFKPLVSHLQMDTRVKGVREDMDKQTRGFSVKKDCQSDKQEIVHLIKSLRNMIEKHNGEIDQLDRHV